MFSYVNENFWQIILLVIFTAVVNIVFNVMFMLGASESEQKIADYCAKTADMAVQALLECKRF